MGYAFMVGPCFICGNVFTFNPVRVPSVRDADGVRQQICRTCIERANVQREMNGLAPFPIARDAYEACDELEVP